MPEPYLIIVMGVSGCGKSTVAEALAKHFDYTLLEADDFHPPENRARMTAGKPLTNSMREPWINSMHAYLRQLAADRTSCVMSFSGLNADHRRRIKSVPMRVTTLHLQGDQALIQSRLNRRSGHFMPSSLLQSQYQALENPNHETNTIVLDIDRSIDALVEEAINKVSIANATIDKKTL